MERRQRLCDEMVNITEIGLQLRNSRVSQGKSMRQVARLAGISVAYLSALEKGENPKTHKPSIPSPEVKNSLFIALGIAEESDSSNFLQDNLSVKGLKELVQFEREKAARMVREGLIRLDKPNSIFDYSIGLATLYGSAAVAMQSVISQLEKEIHALQDKCKIGKVSVNSQGLKVDVIGTQVVKNQNGK